MKRRLKYCLLIALAVATMVLAQYLDLEAIQAKGWLADTLLAAAVNAPYMLLFYTAGYDPKLKGWIPIYAKILFWTFVVLFILGRIMPYVLA